MNIEPVRIENITIENFKNVEKGYLDLENRRKNYQASIVGIYGQNGSGKTALIDALHCIQKMNWKMEDPKIKYRYSMKFLVLGVYQKGIKYEKVY